MSRKIINSFEIKLEFSPNTEDPSRLFRSFASLIDGISQYDSFIAQTAHSSVSNKIILNDIEKGSLIAKLYNSLIINESEKIDTIKDDKSIASYIDKSRVLGLRFIEAESSNIEDLEKLANDIEKIADETGIKNTFHYSPPNILELAKSINVVAQSSNKLTDEENFQISSEEESGITITKDSKLINIEEVENALTEQTIENTTTHFYKIKKPDFLGDSAWEFKQGNKSPKAKILDKKWLDKFLTGKEVVVPGDSLQVNVKAVHKYNKNGYLISEKIEIIEVISVIHNRSNES
jgi:hypothetical protein